MLRRSLVKWCEITHHEFLRNINLNESANVRTQSGAGWVDSFPALCDITVVLILPHISHWSHWFWAWPEQNKNGAGKWWCCVEGRKMAVRCGRGWGASIFILPAPSDATLGGVASHYLIELHPYNTIDWTSPLNCVRCVDCRMW